MANVIYSKCKSYGKKICYSDIIEPFGSIGTKMMGFRIRWSKFGIGSDYIIDYEKLFHLKEQTLIENSVSKGTKYSNQYGYVHLYELYEGKSYNYTGEKFAILDYYDHLQIVAMARDEWIQYWCRGGHIPLGVFPLYEGPPIKQLYPAYVYRSHGDASPLVGNMLGAAAFIGTLVIAFYTSGTAGLCGRLLGQSLKLGLDIVGNTINKAFPSLPKEAEFALTIFQQASTTLIKNKFPEDKKLQKEAGYGVLKFFGDSWFQSLSGESEVETELKINTMIDNFNLEMSDEDQLVLASIALDLDPDAANKIWQAISACTGLSVQDVETKWADVLQEQQEETFIDKYRPWIMLGALGIGTAGLTKVILSKKK